MYMSSKHKYIEFFHLLNLDNFISKTLNFKPVFLFAIIYLIQQYNSKHIFCDFYSRNENLKCVLNS